MAALRIFLTVAGWRVRVEGRENIVENVPRMFVSNHTSYADVVVLIAALGTGLSISFPKGKSSPCRLSARSSQARPLRVRPGGPPRPLKGGPDRADLAPRRIRTRFPRRNLHRAARPTVFSPRRVQGGDCGPREIVPIALEGTRRPLRDGTWLPRRRSVPSRSVRRSFRNPTVRLEGNRPCAR